MPFERQPLNGTYPLRNSSRPPLLRNHHPSWKIRILNPVQDVQPEPDGTFSTEFPNVSQTRATSCRIDFRYLVTGSRGKGKLKR